MQIKSKIKEINLKTLKKIVKNNITFNGVLREIGVKRSGTSIKVLKMRLDNEYINYNHILKNIKKYEQIPLDKILINDSSYQRHNLKKRLLKFELLKNECRECGLKNKWNNKKLTLQIDHINGINNDNRIENLRMLCPNCHSQTETYAGKKNVKSKPNIEKINLKHLIWPTKEKLEKLLWQKPATQIAKEFNVSDVAVAKWAKVYNIKKPGRGYWTKLIK